MADNNTLVLQTARSVCEPCKRRKQSCNKALPRCGRCSRYLVKCWYADATEQSGSTGGSGSQSIPLPPLQMNIIPDFISSPTLPLPIPPSITKSWGEDCNFNFHLVKGKILSIKDQVGVQVHRLLSAVTRKRPGGGVNAFCQIYFRTFNLGLPVLDEGLFYSQLENRGLGENPHFGSLILGMFLVTHLSPTVEAERDSPEELHLTLKSIFSLLQSTGKVTLELIQCGILIASWEFCQALMREVWLSVGCCVRMAQVLGLHDCVREELPKENENERVLCEVKRCVWWRLVVLERLDLASELEWRCIAVLTICKVINQEYTDCKLPFASKAPTADDYLPKLPLQDGVEYRVREDMLLPEDVDLAELKLPVRECTRFGSFAATVQATHLSDLTTGHISDENKSPITRETDSAKLEVALQHYCGACIPPPGKAEGKYCGPYGIRTCAAYALHLSTLSHATQSGNKELISSSTSAIQSLTKLIIYATWVSFQGVKMDFDGIAFWAHRIVGLAGLMCVRFGKKDGDEEGEGEWEKGLEVLKKYLGYFAPRYGVYRNYLRRIEDAKLGMTRTP